jgi:hypothetical protein
MKKLYIIIVLLAWHGQYLSAQSANKSLSNLTSPTAVNVDLLPKTDDSLNLGSISKSWKDIYADGSLYLGGSRFLAFKTGTGSGNTAVGAAALILNTTGTNNTAAGFNALYINTTGKSNTAVGYRSLYANKSGTANTASGIDALYSNTTGTYNTASGAYALYTNTVGFKNTAVGPWALYYNVKGYSNVAIGVDALYKNTDGHNLVAIGDSALYNQSINTDDYYYNTAISSKALYSNTTGFTNTAEGDEALNYNTTGIANTADGVETLYYNTTGNHNTAVGVGALLYNATGNANTANGEETLFYNTTGSSNTAVGSYALSANESLSNLVAVGDSALYDLNGGSGHCTAVGSEAGWQNSSGSNNTYLGYHAGNTVTTGSSNTIIGYGADAGAALTNTTALGNLATATASNQVRIGNNAVTSIGGYANWSNVSDGRVKKNIKQNVPGLAFINKLDPVTYNLDLDAANKIIQQTVNENNDEKAAQFANEDLAAKREKEQIVYTGFVAQDVEKAAKSLNYDFSGVDKPGNDHDLYGLRYGDFVVPLVKAVQELSGQNDSLKKNNQNLNSKVDALEEEVNQLKDLVLSVQHVQQQCSLCTAATISNAIQQNNVTNTGWASLQQNIPNPFNHATTIGYSLPNRFSSAQIVITDKNGKQLKQINVNGADKGTITVDASTLASGAYNYSLYADGKLVATKQMLSAK